MNEKRRAKIIDIALLAMMIVPFVLLIIMVIALGLWSAPLVTFLKNVATGVTF